MRRRQILASGTALLVAGCTGGSDTGGSATDAATDEDTSTAAESGGTADLVVEAVQPGVVITEEDSIGVRSGAGQYLLVAVSGAEGVDPGAFTLTVGTDDYDPIEIERSLFRGEEPAVSYSADDGFGLLVFGLPERMDALDANGSEGQTVLSGPNAETALTERTRTRLGTPSPTFEVSIDAPDVVEENDVPELTISARNDDNVAGNCVLALNRIGPDVASTPVREVVFDLDPGETKTAEYYATSPYHTDSEPEEVTYYLESAEGDQLRRTIEPAE